MDLSKRIRESDTLVTVIAWLIAKYLRFCWRTTRWDREGRKAVEKAVAENDSVIIVCWHQRLMYAPVSWDHKLGRACTLRAVSHAGRISGAVQKQLGLISVPMFDDQSNMAASRKIAKLMRDGVTLGITADGPEGPDRQLKSATLEWARLTQKPVFLFAFATQKHSKWNTWDKLMFPKPFNKGVLIHRQWDKTVPRKPSKEEMEALRQTLENDLNALTDDVDRRVGELT